MFAELAPYRHAVVSPRLDARSVPSHWRIGRVKDAGRLRYGDALSADVRIAGSVRVMGSNGPIGTHESTNTVGRTIVVGRKGSHGKVHLSSDPVWVMDTAYYIDRRSSTENLEWLAQVLKWLPLDETSKDSAVPGLDRDDAHSTPIPIPPADEQAAIVKYLGHAHARIDRAIAAKRKLIALLEEQKQAIIHQAVTRGLDPTVPHKDSGIPWLGQIPTHWNVRKLFSAFELQGSGTTPSKDEYYEGDVPWIMSGDLNNGSISGTKRTVTESAVSEVSSLKVFEPGALVIAMYGATIGKTGVTSMAAATNQACCVFSKPRVGTDVDYVQLAMTIGKPALVEQGFGGGQPNVNAETVRQFKVPMPPGHEQAAIASFCRVESDRVAAIVGRAAREIELLREFRTRLTSDVVTGQVDVREIASTLPELTEDMLANTSDDAEDSLEDNAEDSVEGADD